MIPRLGIAVTLAITLAPPLPQRTARYAVSVEPIGVGLGTLGLCIAVDPTDPHGVWWWEPGASGCVTRSTGPDVFPANKATVTPASNGASAVEFELGTHSRQRPFIRVRLRVDGATIRSLDTNHQVATRPRTDLRVREEPPPTHAAVRLGLDHIPVAVRDLDAAQATYRALGFALKPGRPHENGIRNAHVKFPNGAGLELLTAPAAVDPLSAQYVDMLRAGEGPAFLAFHARDPEPLRQALRGGGYAFRDTNGLIALETPGLGFLFWIQDNRSPTDRPEHFAHANGATGLAAVWIATPDGAALAELLVRLGGRETHRRAFAPDAADATVVTLDEGEVVILPASRQLLPGRPIVGASFQVSDPGATHALLAKAGVPTWTGAGGADRIVVAPAHAHGLWLEFRGGRR
jgi:hypothetical protein